MIRAAAALFVLGGVLLSVFDSFHTRSGTTAYASTWIWGMAWWTVPMFGAVAMGLGLAYARAHRTIAKDAPVASARVLGAGVVAFGALYFASGFLPVGNGAKLVVLGAGSLLLWAAIDRTRAGLLLALAVGALGVAGEAILVHHGAFSYREPDLLGLPIWLPALYAAGATSIGHIARALCP